MKLVKAKPSPTTQLHDGVAPELIISFDGTELSALDWSKGWVDFRVVVHMASGNPSVSLRVEYSNNSGVTNFHPNSTSGAYFRYGARIEPDGSGNPPSELFMRLSDTYQIAVGREITVDLFEISVDDFEGYSTNYLDDLESVVTNNAGRDTMPVSSLINHSSGGDTGDNGGGEEEVQTFHSWVRGSITKFLAPYSLNVSAVSIGVERKLLGTAISDDTTGAYEIDVWPHTGEVLMVAHQEYGVEHLEGLFVSLNTVVHPTTPNRKVLKVVQEGVLGPEPTWPENGTIFSGTAELEITDLYEPLAGGYLKPLIEAI